MDRVRSFLAEQSRLLIIGAILALLWAKLDPAGYHAVVDFVIRDHAAIGFTVSLVSGSVAVAAGPVQDAAKTGALFGFAAAIISLAPGRIARVRKVEA